MYFKSHSAVGRLVGLNAFFNTDESALKSYHLLKMMTNYL